MIRLGPRPQNTLDEVLSGRVLGPDGAPIADALVSATPHSDEPATSDASLRPTLQAMSDAEGRFTVSGLDAERYDVDATRDGYAPASVEGVTSGTIDLVLELGRGGRIRGRVTDAATGEPFAAFTVVVDLLRGPLERDPLARLSVFDAQGRYEIPGVPPGSYAVTAVALGHARPSARRSRSRTRPRRWGRRTSRSAVGVG